MCSSREREDVDESDDGAGGEDEHAFVVAHDDVEDDGDSADLLDVVADPSSSPDLAHSTAGAAAGGEDPTDEGPLRKRRRFV